MLEITSLLPEDPPLIAAAFTAIGWDKPEAQYARYLDEQIADDRPVLVARVGGAFAGYLTWSGSRSTSPSARREFPKSRTSTSCPNTAAGESARP